ncbi:MAG: hypothetical protein IT246_01745 [Bacteroidia bacterium]|nr:hypothetical protein [Bacteroidia bacterium]
MNHYYDTKLVYPYICLSDISETELKQLISFLKKSGFNVNKFYEKPQYPASNNIKYDFLLRLDFSDSSTKTKPEKNKIDDLINEFQDSQKVIQEKEQNNEGIFESDKKYFDQIRLFLDSERRIIELDKQFIKEQLGTINQISNNLQKEYERIFSFNSNYNMKLNEDIVSLIKTKSIDDKQLMDLKDKLSEKENLLAQKENELNIKIKEVENEKERIENYKASLEDEYKSMITQIRNEKLGIQTNEEDSIQNLRILIFGESKIRSNEIYEIFNKEFIKQFEEELNRKCIEVHNTEYKKTKNSNIINKILLNNYDYIIIGPHDHSIKGKNAKKSFKTLKKERNLKAFIYEQLEDPLNPKVIKELAERIIKNWDEEFEVIQ